MWLLTKIKQKRQEERERQEEEARKREEAKKIFREIIVEDATGFREIMLREIIEEGSTGFRERMYREAGFRERMYREAGFRERMYREAGFRERMYREAGFRERMLSKIEEDPERILDELIAARTTIEREEEAIEREEEARKREEEAIEREEEARKREEKEEREIETNFNKILEKELENSYLDEKKEAWETQKILNEINEKGRKHSFEQSSDADHQYYYEIYCLLQDSFPRNNNIDDELTKDLLPGYFSTLESLLIVSYCTCKDKAAVVKHMEPKRSFHMEPRRSFTYFSTGSILAVLNKVEQIKDRIELIKRKRDPFSYELLKDLVQTERLKLVRPLKGD